MRSLFARLHRRYGSRISGTERKLQVRGYISNLQRRFPIEDWLASSTARPPRSRPKLVVIGAGFGGLAGGRVHTIWDRSGRGDGQFLSSHRQEKLYAEMQHAFDRMCREARSLQDPYRPWRSAEAERRDNRSLLDWIESLQCSRLAKNAIEAQFANDNGASAARQSFLANLALVAGAASKDHPDGFFKFTENVRCEDGNQALAEKLAESVQAQGGVVELRDRVTRIELRDSKVVVTAATPWPHTRRLRRARRPTQCLEIYSDRSADQSKLSHVDGHSREISYSVE
jgi:hypothetical protein